MRAFNRRKMFLLLIVSYLFICILASFAYAGPNYRSVSRLERNISRQEKKLIRKFNRLSLSDKARVIESRSGKSDDSDLDGVPDNFEESAGRCDSDSDDDGVNDGDEYENGTDPDDEDSDDDGHNDGDEFEVTGDIENITSTTITVGSITYILNNETEYLDDNDQSIPASSFTAGDCVEVEGHNDGDDKIVDKVQEDDDC